MLKLETCNFIINNLPLRFKPTTLLELEVSNSTKTELLHEYLQGYYLDSVSDLLRFCGENFDAIELETVLGIQIDNILNFKNHIKSICSKTSQKLRVLQRILKSNSHICKNCEFDRSA